MVSIVYALTLTNIDDTLPFFSVLTCDFNANVPTGGQQI